LQLPGQPLPLDHPNVLRADGVILATTRSYADVVAGREEIALPEFVYVREGQLHGPLAPTYSGPYKVLEQRGKAVKLQLGERADWVALETVKDTGEAPVVLGQPPACGRPRRRPNESSGAAEDSGVCD